ncbi:MAG: hypothetical protein KGL35_11545 [Bradyrhizobium sp.]|uniref:hypothetical protein n=1 Tax=Bradyrhizobium sp. TaxID=376 RepID=UPI001C28C9B4|nr:hypothetical protein [Bradyrhizobium sp.]MBU6464010.1 hypothetical protein [Pseudomonadota bacterium]MDE2069029.1 hypothetical protein [Bradyrhizobium sp.]MDE2469349.1 hypothetical protein [Bradyrhizobium sp.]
MMSIYESLPCSQWPAKSFRDVALSRRTMRVAEPMALSDLMMLVRFVVARREIGIAENSGRSRKIPVSAGALHPIDVLIVAGPGISGPIVYSDVDDSFGSIPLINAHDFSFETEKLESMLPHAKGHLLLFTGDLDMVDRAYENPESLLWRDAGAMLQCFAFAATALDLAFVPLGSLGASVLRNLRCPSSTFSAVATAFIGVAKSD